MSNAKVLSNATFQSNVLEAHGPVLVDFYADWCAPCRVQGPIVDGLANEYEDRATVAKVDIEAAPELARRYQVHSIPTLVVFKDGEVVETLVGVQSPGALKDTLDALLANPARPSAD